MHFGDEGGQGADQCTAEFIDQSTVSVYFHIIDCFFTIAWRYAAVDTCEQRKWAHTTAI